MIVKIEGSTLTAIREKGDPRFTRSNWCPDAESTLLYHIKNILNKRGFDLIKTRMCKDGHMVDDMQHYLRTRKPTHDPQKDVMIYNPSWAIAGEEERFNKGQEAQFTIIYDCFNEKGE